MTTLFGKEKEDKKVEEPNKGYQTMETFEANKVDAIGLLADVSHQLEEARTKIVELEKANIQWREEHIKARAVSEAFRQLIIDLHVKI